ncbi:MAG TPA: hypothetical protein VLG12_06340 [Candidatus Saccharimonadales bacterium]|nr:hypothetical protein [Candidatus Saccharimonadales bacterium]
MDMLLQLQLTCEMIIFLSVIVMNVAKKNTSLIMLYLLQSVLLVSLLSIQAYQEASAELFIVTMVMFIIKVLIAPQVFLRFIHRSHLNFSASTYLNVPMTLGVLILLSVFAQSDVFSPIFLIIPHISQLSMFLIGSILISFFLIVNRKGALSQIIGVLSLENCIFAFGHFLGIKQSNSLEIGILFDVFFWIIISSVFMTMIYTHYGSLDVTELKELQK